MTYDAKEKSKRGGNPVEFVRLVLNADNKWLYTSADEPIIYNGEVYEPVSLGRTNPQMSDEIEQAKLTLTIPLNCPVIEKFKRTPPNQSIYVTYFRKHRDDAEVIPYWQGRIAGVKFADETTQVIAQSLEAMLERTGARPLWQRTCRFFLYDGEGNGGHGCPVPRSAFKSMGTVLSVNRDQLTSAAVAAKPDNWFSLGYAERSDGTKRFVLSHTADTLTLLAPFDPSPLGETLAFYAGCDNDHSTCINKFGAYTRGGLDFGGTPLVPISNPFTKGIR